MLKECRWCNKIQSLEDFHRNKCTKDGRINKCKSCCKEYELTPERKATYKKRNNSDKRKAWQRANNWKWSVYQKVYAAIEKGEIESGPCEDCGSMDDLHAHHDDYNYPLKIRWLCPQHHADWHAENKPIYPTK